MTSPNDHQEPNFDLDAPLLEPLEEMTPGEWLGMNKMQPYTLSVSENGEVRVEPEDDYSE